MWCLILAQTIDPAAELIKEAMGYGVPGTLCISIVYVARVVASLCRTHGPRLVEAHLQFVAAVKEQMQRTSDLLESEVGGRDLMQMKVSEAIRHGCSLLRIWARNHPQEQEIQQHIAAILSALDRPRAHWQSEL